MKPLDWIILELLQERVKMERIYYRNSKRVGITDAMREGYTLSRNEMQRDIKILRKVKEELSH